MPVHRQRSNLGFRCRDVHQLVSQPNGDAQQKPIMEGLRMKRTHVITGLHTQQPKTNTVVPFRGDVVGPYSLLTELQPTRTVIVGRNQPRTYTRGWLL